MKHIQKLRKLILTLGILAGMSLTAYAASETTVTYDLSVDGKSINKGGVTCTEEFDSYNNHFGGTFTTSNGKFTKIVVNANDVKRTGLNRVDYSSIEGWSSDHSSATWTGNSSSVQFGTIMGNSGNVTITFTIEPSVDVTGVSLNKKTSTLTVGDMETLTATVSPEDATDKSVTWSSGNTSVATVDANGKVTAVAEGTATITVTATNGTVETSDDKTATCVVTVVPSIIVVTAKADPYNTSAYYATFYDSTTSYVADSEVYYATANADGRLTLQKAEGNVIKAGEGVILKATSETVTLTPTTTEASYDSLLTGSDSETTVENALVLSLGKNGVWFYKYSGTLGANKAYLAQ